LASHLLSSITECMELESSDNGTERPFLVVLGCKQDRDQLDIVIHIQDARNNLGAFVTETALKLCYLGKYTKCTYKPRAIRLF
jgi:hypothetical protein